MAKVLTLDKKKERFSLFCSRLIVPLQNNMLINQLNNEDN